MTAEAETAALRREVVSLRLDNRRLRERIPQLCFGPCRCEWLHTEGIFPVCGRTGLAVGPEDYCSRHRAVTNTIKEEPKHEE